MPVESEVPDNATVEDVLTGASSIVVDTEENSYRFEAPATEESVATPTTHEWSDIPFGVVRVLYEEDYIDAEHFVGAKRRRVDWPVRVRVSYRNEHPLVSALSRAGLGTPDELDEDLYHEGSVVTVTFEVTESHEYEVLEAEVEGTRLTPDET